MKAPAKLKWLSLLADPHIMVIGLAVAGAGCIVSGVALLAGKGWSVMSAGVFLIVAAGYITQGLKPNG